MMKDKYDFTHMWNLRNTTDEYRGREGKIRKKRRRRQIIRDFFKTEKKLGVAGG